MKKTSQNVLATLFISFIALFLSLILAEVILRAIYPQDLLPIYNPDIYENNRTFGWTFKVNSSFKTISPDAKEKVRLSFNSEGFRHSNYDQNKQKILLVGDSTTAGIQVNLEEHFGTHINNYFSNYEVINAGINGFSTDQAFTTMQYFINKHDISMVIYLLNTNDIPGNLFRNMSVGIYRYGKPYSEINDLTLEIKNNSYQERKLRDLIIINEELMYELEFSNNAQVVKIIKESPIYKNSYETKKELNNDIRKNFEEPLASKISGIINARAMNPPVVKKVLKRREQENLYEAPHILSLFIVKKRTRQILDSLNKEILNIFNDEDEKDYLASDELQYCPQEFKITKSNLYNDGLNLTEQLIIKMQALANLNKVKFLLVPHLNYITEYDYLNYAKSISNKFADCNAEVFLNDIENISNKNNVHYVSDVIEIAKKNHSNIDHYDFKDHNGKTINGHYSNKGHLITAEGIIRYIQKNSLLGQ